MTSYLIAFVAALALSVFLTPLARSIAFRLGAVSSPGGRHIHSRVIPRLGGLALATAWCVPLVTLYLLDSHVVTITHGKGWQVLGLVVGGLALCAVGAVDDTRGVSASQKLLFQVLAAVLAFACGFRIEGVALPVVGSLSMGVFAVPVTVLWIVGITNAVNLIDGLDGLAAGVAFFAAFTNFTVAYLSGSPFVALMMACLMGALIGFLFFNFNPARIFMGDSGSLFLGFLLATTSLAGALQQKASTAVSLLVPVIALGVPIFDTLFSMVRRFLERRPIFSPDRGHIHHRLLELGLTQRRAVMLLYGVSVALTASAVAVSLGRSWQIGVALLLVSVIFVGLVRFLGYFQYLHGRRRQNARLYDVSTESLRHVVPSVLAEIARAEDQEGVFESLGKLVSADLVSGDHGVRAVDLVAGNQVLQHWKHPVFDPKTRDVVQATFPVGAEATATTKLRFLWASETEEVSPQADILLQLIADATARALVRCRSQLVPETASSLSESIPPGVPVPLPSAPSN